MIAAYAQASDRQGLDAAVDGRTVAIDDESFTALREKGAALNLRTKRHLTGNVDVRFGQSVVRLELPGSEQDAATRSPIVVVLDIEELRAGRGTAVQRVVETVTGIGRQCDPAAIEAGIDAGERMGRARLSRAMIGFGTVVVVLLVVAVVWVVRSKS